MNKKLHDQLCALDNACIDLDTLVQGCDTPLPKEVATVYNLSETLRIMLHYAIDKVKEGT